MVRPIEVVGSLNIDLVTTTARVPGPGETIKAESFSTGFGGKGANQAVACSRLLHPDARAAGAHVRMVGAVGGDQFGVDMMKQLHDENIASDGVKVVESEKTGTSLIIVEQTTGENRILFSPAANYSVKPADVTLADDAKHGLVVFQLEIPLDTVLHGLAQARRMSKETIFNPSPAVAVDDAVFSNIDHLIVNESEACILSGASAATLSESLDRVADIFISKGVSCVIITLGSKGVFWKTGPRFAPPMPAGRFIAAQRVKAVDTTAAGDTFAGAYAARLAQASSTTQEIIESAVAFANRAAAVAVQKAGAQASVPRLDEMPADP